MCAFAADECGVTGRTLSERLRLRLAGETGFSLVELIVVMAIMLVVLVAITGSFTSASRSEVNVSLRQQAQADGRLALDLLRRDLRCAYYVQSISQNRDSGGIPIEGGGFSLSVTERSDQCQAIAAGVGSNSCGQGTSDSCVFLQWCTIPISGEPGTFGLYRANTTCNSSNGKLIAEIVEPRGGWPENAKVTPQPATGIWDGNLWPDNSRGCEVGFLPVQAVQLAVNPDLDGSPTILYELKDEIALRNASRCALAALSLGVTVPATANPGETIAATAIKGTLLELLGTGDSAAVTFRVYGPSVTPPDAAQCAAAPVVGTATPTGNGIPMHSNGDSAPLSVGTYWWYASWPGDVANGIDADSDPLTPNVPVPVNSVCDATMAKTVVAPDTTLPILTLTAPAGGATTGVTPTLSGAAGYLAGDSNTVTVTIYNGTGTGGSVAQTIPVTRTGATWSTTVATPLAAGTYTAQASQADSSGNTGTSTANTFTVDTTSPTVTLTAPANASSTNNQQPTLTGAAGNATGDSTIVTVTIYNGSGTGGTVNQTIPVTRSGATWSTPSLLVLADGTYTAQATQVDSVGNTGTSSANVFTVDTTGPTVTIDQAAAQADPTNAFPINFTVVFSESVTGFAGADVTLSGTAGATTKTVTGSGTTYNVALSGLSGQGTLIATVNAGGAADGAGNTNSASTSTDNTVTRDTVAPTVTINQAAAQADPANALPINFTVVFSESTTNFVTGDVTLTGTAGATIGTVTGSGTTYNVAVSGLTGQGTVIASIAAGVATDAAGNNNAAATFTDHTVTYNTAPNLSTLQFFDTDVDGKIDQIKATFDETLAAYSAGTAPWTLAGAPAGTSIASVSVAGAVATLTLNEGAVNTAAVGMTLALATNVNGIRDAGGQQSSFTATAVADKAGPVPTNVTSTNAATLGRIDVGDTLTITFSETIAAPTTGTASISEADPPGGGNDTLTIAGVSTASNTGSNAYVSGNNSNGTFASSTRTVTGSTITVTVAGACTGSCGANLTAGTGALAFVPVVGITDAAGNAAAGSFTTAAGFRLF